MPGFELISSEEQEAVNKIFKDGGILFAHGFDSVRKNFTVREFEGDLQEYLGSKHALAVSSGTAAIKIALKALGVKPGDEVITQAFNFIATIEAILDIGAIPVINNNKKLAGIISERDIVKALANYKNKDYSILLVNQLMTKTVISCEKEVLSDKLMELMTINKIRHIPIVENNAPIGIVSIGDVVNRLIEKVQYENKMLKDFVSG